MSPYSTSTGISSTSTARAAQRSQSSASNRSPSFPRKNLVNRAPPYHGRGRIPRCVRVHATFVRRRARQNHLQTGRRRISHHRYKHGAGNHTRPRRQTNLPMVKTSIAFSRFQKQKDKEKFFFTKQTAGNIHIWVWDKNFILNKKYGQTHIIERKPVWKER